MRHAAEESNKKKSVSRHPAEEYELETVRSAADEAPADSAFTTVPISNSPTTQNRKPQSSWKKWTSRHPYIHYVPLKAARDHLANERVFLAYIRTGMALANAAIVILQLYRLKHNPPPKGRLSDYSLGIPLAMVMLLVAIAVSLAGSWRYFVCQKAMATRKQIVTAGRVVLVLTPILILFSLAIFVFTIIIDPDE